MIHALLTILIMMSSIIDGNLNIQHLHIKFPSITLLPTFDVLHWKYRILYVTCSLLPTISTYCLRNLETPPPALPYPSMPCTSPLRYEDDRDKCSRGLGVGDE